MNNRVYIFDTTLRDGEQSPGCSMNFEEKIRMARQLERLQVDVIEAGFPIASEGDFESVKEIAKQVRGCSIAALSRATKKDIDRAWEALKYAAHPRIHTFIATSDIHLQFKLKKSREQVLDDAIKAVRHAASLCPDVEFSCEDGSRSDIDYICTIVEAVYHLEWRATLADALTTLRSRDFDMVLLDLNLPDSTELPTLTRILETTRGVPVVVLTATDDDTIGLKAVQAGAQDYLVKGECSGPALDRSIVYSIERFRLQQTLRQLAVLDALTGLYNRRGFNTLNPDILQQVKTGEARGYLACFDLDRFKQINDTHGHACGDSALVEFATLLRNAFRKEGLFARLGGDEFLAMGIETHPGAATAALASLAQLLAVRNTAGLSPFCLEASAGLVMLTRDDQRPLEELLTAADTELYRNKEARRTARLATPLAATKEQLRP